MTEGLSGGASLVIGKLDGVKPGTKVRIAGTPAPAVLAAASARKG